MKKTKNKHLLRTIKKNGVSFFAVAFIAATSIAIFSGLQSSATAILEDTDRYFSENNLAAFEVSCADGLTEDDLHTMEAWDDIDAVEGGYSTMVLMDGEREQITLQALSVSEHFNRAVVLEGTLPAASDEIAVEQIFAERQSVHVGDELTLTHAGNLVNDTFHVTAIVNQPAFCCARIQDSRGKSTTGLGSAAYYVMLSADAFNDAYYNGHFTKAYLRCDGLNELYFYSDAYKAEETAVLDRIETLCASDDTTKDWIFSGRNDMGDVRAVKTIVDGIYGLSYSMSIIFLLVAIVVCHAAISRMIDEQRPLIGAQKALGFRAGEILKHYMFYNTLCALLGILLGWVFSAAIVELLVLAIFTPEFLIGSIALSFAWKEALLAAGICLAIFLTTTYVACAKLVRLPATTLLRGEVPVQGKRFFFEKWSGYKKLTLYTRTMIKNVLNDKARMMTTVMGVVGCISLLVVCFSLKMAIEDSSVKQFDDYFLYENRLVIDTSSGNTEAFEQVLTEENISYTLVQDKLKNFRVADGDWENAHIIAAKDFESLKDFIVLEDVDTKQPAGLPADGVLVSRKCAEMNNLSVGSTVELMDAAGNPKTVTIAGVIEHYLSYHLFVTTDSYYETAMDEPADSCVFLLHGSIDGLYDKVRNMDGFLSLKDNSEFAANADAINMVIAICLVLSAVMALLVQLNQIVMHINRKARELAVMRINGYTRKETKAYIYKDNIVLTLLGLIMGSGFGILLSYIVVRIIETGANRYVRTPNLPACLYACVVGAFFALGVNLIALRKINTLNLTNVSGN